MLNEDKTDIKSLDIEQGAQVPVFVLALDEY